MNARRKLIWKLFPYFLVLALAAAAGSAVIACAGRDGSTTLALWQWVGILLLAAACASASFAVIWKINRSLEVTREGARRFAEGDLGFRLKEPRSEELGGLAVTLNAMAAQLNERITTINRQRSEQEAILGSMSEGVIAFNDRLAILQVNPAAARLLGTTPEQLINRSLHEVIRNREFHRVIEKSLAEGKPVEGELTYYGVQELYLRVQCSPLLNPEGRRIGALAVLDDMTRLRRLEGVRRDFVANVSHELKTPLTSIKGFVETLQDGALEQPEEARRFCAIIAKQVDRLQAIIEDLLSLSRIEQEAERGQIAFKETSIREVLEASAGFVHDRAEEKGIPIHIECDPSFTALMHPAQFEQVAVNLIDNAIKYSEPGRPITIRVTSTPQYWEIRFIDNGCGIDQVHLTRIFERFYRVDKARSRKAGGTGLGLAIVKHIVTAHGGRVRVESEPGKGSTFTVFLPRRTGDTAA